MPQNGGYVWALQVLMVLFDIMASHWAMMTWHDARLAESAAVLAQLQQVRLWNQHRHVGAGSDCAYTFQDISLAAHYSCCCRRASDRHLLLMLGL